MSQKEQKSKKQCSPKGFCKGLTIRIVYLIILGGIFAIGTLISYERQQITCVFNLTGTVENQSSKYTSTLDSTHQFISSYLKIPYKEYYQLLTLNNTASQSIKCVQPVSNSVENSTAVGQPIDILEFNESHLSKTVLKNLDITCYPQYGNEQDKLLKAYNQQCIIFYYLTIVLIAVGGFAILMVCLCCYTCCKCKCCYMFKCCYENSKPARSHGKKQNVQVVQHVGQQALMPTSLQQQMIQQQMLQQQMLNQQLMQQQMLQQQQMMRQPMMQQYPMQYTPIQQGPNIFQQ